MEGLKKLLVHISYLLILLSSMNAENRSSNNDEIRKLLYSDEVVIVDFKQINDDKLFFITNKVGNQNVVAFYYIIALSDNKIVDTIKLKNSTSSPCYFNDKTSFVCQARHYETYEHLLIFYSNKDKCFKTFSIKDRFVANMFIYDSFILWSTENDNKVIRRLNTQTNNIYSYNDYLANAIFYTQDNSLFLFDPSSNMIYEVVQDTLVKKNVIKTRKELYESPGLFANKTNNMIEYLILLKKLFV